MPTFSSQDIPALHDQDIIVTGGNAGQGLEQMANHLPLELVYQIANYLDSAGVPLRPYALVCRAWQVVFEPLIYKYLKFYVHSEDFGTGKNGIIRHFAEPIQTATTHEIMSHIKGVSLAQFNGITSTPRRRTFVRDVTYRIVVPYHIHDYRARFIEGPGVKEPYTKDNPIRIANDQAFKAGVIKLFKSLQSWSESHRLRLELELMGREQVLEPGTKKSGPVREYSECRWGDRVTQPYRARFPGEDGELELSLLPCAYEMHFINWVKRWDPTHRIWPGAALKIASRCPNLHTMSLDLYEYVRPDHLDYMQERRKALSEGVSMLPSTLRVFRYENRCETVWHKSLPGPDLLIDGKDMLGLNLRQLSSHLQELELTGVILDREFLCPPDENGKPALPLVEWPHLKVLVYHEMPNFLPSGKWLSDPTAEDLEDILLPDWDSPYQDDWETFRIIDEEPYRRSELNSELAQRCFTSLGLAAQHMPQLKSLTFFFMVSPTLGLTLFTDEATGKRFIQWQASRPFRHYMPDQRVAEAWGLGLDGLEDLGKTGGSLFRVSLRQWPPVSAC